MSKITNKMGLPIQLVNLVSNDYKPTPKQYSCTTILKSTKSIILGRRYNDYIEQDVSDLIWCIFGTLAHSVIENSQEDVGQFKEEKLRVDLGKYHPDLKGYYLSGRSDLIDLTNKKIVDWKTCSAWKVIYKDFEDWRKEMLIYAWAVRDMGFEIESAEAIAFIKDHKKKQSEIDKKYPPLPIWVQKFNFTEKDFKEIESFIIEKFLDLKKYENVKDEELPICSPEDRWNTGDKYAVKKKKNKRADRVYDTLEEAKEHLERVGESSRDLYEIEERKGIDKRCVEGYCSCHQFCPYWRQKYGS